MVTIVPVTYVSFPCRVSEIGLCEVMSSLERKTSICPFFFSFRVALNEEVSSLEQ